MNKKIATILATILVVAMAIVPVVSAHYYNYQQGVNYYQGSESVSGVYGTATFYATDFDQPWYETAQYWTQINIMSYDCTNFAEVGLKTLDNGNGELYCFMSGSDGGSTFCSDTYLVPNGWNGASIGLAVGKDNYVWRAYINTGNGWYEFDSHQYNDNWYGDCANSGYEGVHLPAVDSHTMVSWSGIQYQTSCQTWNDWYETGSMDNYPYTTYSSGTGWWSLTSDL